MDTPLLRKGRISVDADHVACELDGETVILQMTTGMYYGLNEVGSFVWNALQEPKTFDQIVEILVREYGDVARDVIEQDVEDLLSSMLSEGLVQVRDASIP